jgi:hypothetical protein
MIYLVFALLFIAYLYFNHKDDYKNGTLDFKKIVLPLLGIVIIGLIIFFIRTNLKPIVKEAISSYYESKLGISNEQFDKVNSAMSIYNVLFYVLIFLILNQFNKFLKKRNVI